MKFRLSDLVLYLYEDTLVPELFEVLGEDGLIRFLRTFGGVKLEIPSYKKILDLQRNIDIYNTLNNSYDTQTIERLADKYDITRVWVREMYKKMCLETPKIEEFVKSKRRLKEILVTSKRMVRQNEQEITKA